MTPLKAIRKKCLECCCGQCKEIRLCPSKDCPLYPFRFGKNPNRINTSSKVPVPEKMASHDSIFNIEDGDEGNYLGDEISEKN